MKFALSLPNAGPATRLVDIAVQAEHSAWDAVFLWDHLQLFRDMRLELHDPWVLLGAIAGATSRIRVGTMVTPLPRRRPQKYAKEVVTLDHLSHGRVICGVGLGFPSHDEFASFGEPSDDRERGERLDEALEVVTALWTSTAVDHDGSHFQVHAEMHPPPVQRPHPPIWVGLHWPNPRGLGRAARHAGAFPIARDGQPATLSQLEELASALPSGHDVIGSWMPGATIAQYAAAGVTWLVESRWPDGSWLDELDDASRTNPHGGA